MTFQHPSPRLEVFKAQNSGKLWGPTGSGAFTEQRKDIGTSDRTREKVQPSEITGWEDALQLLAGGLSGYELSAGAKSDMVERDFMGTA